MGQPTWSELLGIIGATVVAASTVVAYSFTNFDTKDRAVERSSFIESRLNRIEQKVDSLLERIRR